MIRECQPSDLPALLDVWLASTTAAHPFIDPLYWQQSLPLVRDSYLPDAHTWVYLENGKLLGFISVMNASFVGALFVAQQAAGRGIGSALLNEAKRHYAALSLEVYQKNTLAVNFYHRQGFRIEDSAWQEETQHPTWIMHWQADQTPSR